VIDFRALGPAELEGPEGADTRAVLARPKLLGLLAFLTLGARRGFQRRDSLIGMFWAELDQARARSAVRQSLYRLRLFLGEGVVVTRGDDEVSVSETEFRSDVEAFEGALDDGDRAAALSVYRGDLLEGFYVPDAPEFERWIDTRRKQLRQLASTAAWELADQEARLKHTGAAGHWGRHARSLAPLDERMLQRVIKLLDQLGDRAGAVREYETFARRLADELDLEPSPETEALVEGVRARSDAVRPPSLASPPGSAERPGEALMRPPQSVTPEPTIAAGLADRYRLVKEIGTGGMATVYLARDLRHERDVAVKLMRSDLAVHMGLERFLHEIQIAANLTHPHIVPLYDSGTVDGRPYYVMPYIKGESLRDRLEREGQLALGDALAIARDVGEALAHAHDHGIVHRDIKPENILLSGGHALVADFGIARAASIAREARLTMAGMAMGTPLYMSPEQSVGSGEVDGRSDVYSLACVLYEMLGGEPPFVGSTAEGIARQHVHSVPRPITDLRATVPEKLALAVAQALAKTAADRFDSASSFVTALERGVTRHRAWPFGVRRRATVLSATAASLIIVAAIIIRLIAGLAPDLDPYRVVIVPLENRTGDPTLALLGSMAADWIARGLREVDVIDVVPTATAIEPGPDIAGLARSSEPGTARAAGLATRAGTVIAGAYYRRGDSLEFQTQVIDAVEERLARAVEPVTVPIGESGSAMDSLRRRVVTTVAAVLDQRLLPSTAASNPPSLEAYRAYLDGHRAFYHGVPLRMREALEFMYRAVELDSAFADPRFFIIMAHYNLGELSAADSNAELLLPFRSQFSPYQRAFLDWLIAGLRGDRAGALRAARARGVLVDVAVEALKSNRPHESIEILSGNYDLSAFYFHWQTLMEALHMVGDFDSELAEARRARQAYPDRLVMLRNELRVLAARGRLEEVERGLDESLLLPPEGAVVAGNVMGEIAAELRAHGFREASLGVADRALRWYRSRPSEGAANIPARVGLAMTLYQAERWEEARASFEELATAVPGDVTVQGYLGFLAARSGDQDEAMRISNQLAGMANPYDFGRDIYLQACIAAQLGDLDRAMVLLREAYARGRSFGITLHRDMDLEPLRDYPPFQEFIEPKG
jgi:serine/threonine protein kinase/DNA-binding SARP family transcriptional activator/tetratricopeptide (TPR) repeat protein